MKAWIWVAAFAVALLPAAAAGPAESIKSLDERGSSHEAKDEKKPSSNEADVKSPKEGKKSSSNEGHVESPKDEKGPKPERNPDAGDSKKNEEPSDNGPLPADGPAPNKPPGNAPTGSAPPPQSENRAPSDPPGSSEPPAPSPAVPGDDATAPPWTLEAQAASPRGLSFGSSSAGGLQDVLQSNPTPRSSAAPPQAAPQPIPTLSDSAPGVQGDAVAPATLPAIPGTGTWSSWAVGALTIGALTAGALGGYTLRVPGRLRFLAARKVPSRGSLDELLLRIREAPLDAEAHFQLGVELIRQEQAPSALSHLQRSFRIRPDLVLRLLEDPEFGPILHREDVRRILKRFHREQQQKLWAGYA